MSATDNTDNFVLFLFILVLFGAHTCDLSSCGLIPLSFSAAECHFTIFGVGRMGDTVLCYVMRFRGVENVVREYAKVTSCDGKEEEGKEQSTFCRRTIPHHETIHSKNFGLELDAFIE